MSLLCFICFMALSAPAPAPAQTGESPDLLNPAEQRALQSASTLDQRLKVYLNAGHERIQTAAKAREHASPEAFASLFEQYQGLLRICQEQMDRNPPLKARQAKNLEIMLRKQIQHLNDLAARAELADQNPIRQSIDSAQRLRSRLLKIFFGTGALPEKE